MAFDVRYAVRRLRSTPGLTVAVVLTLAVGVAATAATFSLVQATVLEPLPFPAADRLVRLRELTPQGQTFSLSEPDYRDYADRLRTVSSLAALRPVQVTLTGAGDPVRLDGTAVSASIFDLLGVRPAIGRTFDEDDDHAGHPAAVVLLGDAVWRTRFGGDPAVIGRTIRLDGRASMVVGVLPAGAVFPPSDVWLPLGASADADRTDKWLDAIGRLRPGATLADARADATLVASNLARVHPELRGWTARVEPLSDWLVGPGLARMVWILLGAVGFLLVLACANIAGLLTTRATGRRGEMGVRAALGAGRARLVRQLMTESSLLAIIGGALGILLTFWMLAAMSAVAGDLLPLGRVARVDGLVLLVLCAVVAVAALGFGLTPALHAAHVDLRTALRAAPRGASARGRGWPEALVSVQVALAMLLLVGAFLMAGSFTRLSAVDPGFDPRGVMTVPVSMPPAAYSEAARVTFFREATRRLAALPGIRAVAATATNPFRQFGYANDVTPEDRAADAPPSGLLIAGWRSVTPGFFSTLGIPLVAGRDFTNADDEKAPRVAVISRGLADRLWPGHDAVGRRFFWGGLDGFPRIVVGVAADIRDVRLDGDVTPLVYLPYEQLPLEDMTLLLRTRPGVAGVPAAVRYELHAIDPNLPVPEIRPLEANRAAAIATPRLRAVLLAAFGAAALLLACIGLYGVIAFTIAQRTREIGIRVALGARPTQVVGVFFRHGIRIIALGGAAGLASAWVLARFLRTLLFHTDARDPALFALAAGVLALVAALATYIPARRAAHLDPVAAITHEQL